MNNQCPYCQPDTAGNHQFGCPSFRHHWMPAITPQGWVCPKCGSVWAPQVLSCVRCTPTTLSPTYAEG